MDSFDKFKKDLRYGEDSEILFCIYLIKNDLIINNLNLDYKYDIKAFSKKLDRHLFFELKTDKFVDKENDTGNMAIEIRYKKRPSGVSKTKADWFVYFFRNLKKENIWMIKCSDLKDLIKNNNFKKVMGGDNNASELVLIPRNNHKESFNVISYPFTKKEKNLAKLIYKLKLDYHLNSDKIKHMLK